MNYDYDVIIVGGGLVGGSLALALRDTHLKILLVEAQSHAERMASTTGNRALALSRGSVQILQQLGIWVLIKDHVAAIRHIHVSDRGHFGKVRLEAHDEQVDALGYVVLAKFIENSFESAVTSLSLTHLCPSRLIALKAVSDGIYATIKKGDVCLPVTARLVVAADGGNSSVRSLLGIGQEIYDYDQTAIVTEISTEFDTKCTAYERFTQTGPLAVLPLADHLCSVVWTCQKEDAQELLDQSQADFESELQTAFGYWLGKIKLANQRQGFPLRLVKSSTMTDDRVVLIGNAMHQIHPVAGQGFNLGLRDAAVLAEWIKAAGNLKMDIGERSWLSGYAESRKHDLNQVVYFTDGLVRLFSNNSKPLGLFRNMGLLAIDRIPSLKRMLAKHAMGYGFRV